jgi:hypothetical protein
MQNKKFIISSDDLFSIVTTLYVARFVIYTLIDNFVVKILYQDIHIDVRKIVLNVFKWVLHGSIVFFALKIFNLLLLYFSCDQQNITI